MQVVVHVRLCRLTRVNAACQSPFRPRRPLLKVFAECSTSGLGNTLANVEIQVPALGQIRDEPGCVPEFREHHPLPMVLRLGAAVVLTRLRIFLFFDWVLAIVFRATNGRAESKEGS